MKRRIISIFVILSMVLSLTSFFNISVSAAGTKPSGSGTVSDPFLIGDLNEFIWFRDSINAGSIPNTSCADFTDNIYMNRTQWTPINTFCGTLDGRNYTVYDSTYNPLIHVLSGGSVKNVHIVNSVNITRTDAGFGGIVYFASSAMISNCSFEGRMESSENYDCYGGIAAIIESTTLTDCYAIVTISSTSVGNEDKGGLAGRSSAHCYIKRCYVEGDIKGYYDVGGFVGEVGGGTSAASLNIENSYFKGTVDTVNEETRNRTGLFDGWNSGGTPINIKNSYGYSLSSTPLCGPFATYDGGKNITYENARYRGSGGVAATSMGLSDEQFAAIGNFNGWDFTTDDGNPAIWKMNTRPMLKQRIDASSKSRELVLFDDGKASFNLSDYFDLILAEDRDYHQNNRFAFYIIDGANDSTTYSIEKNGESIIAAEIDGDELTLNGEVGFGTYGPYTIKAVDKLGKFDTYTFPLTAIVKHRVPVPKITQGSLPYSRYIKLGSLPISPTDDNWEWTNPEVCPKDSARWPEGYEAFYPFEDGMKDYYDTSLLDEAGIKYTVTETGVKVMMTDFITESDTSPWDTTVTVLDGDKLTPISGAEVSCDYDDEFPKGNTTGADGSVYAQLSKGNRTIRATATGYKDGEDKFEIKANNKNTATLKLEPVRYSFALPAVHDEDNTSKEIEGARVTATRLPEDENDTTLAWNGGDPTLTDDAKADTVLPDGKYLFTSATYGYTKHDKLWGVVSGDKITYYNNEACSTGTEAEGILYAKKMTEPLYHMQINKGSGKEYTVTVDLQNIKATFGSFGLRWDTDLFTMKSFTLSRELESYMTAEEIYGASYANSQARITAANNNGYFDFMWQTDNESSGAFDTERDKKTVATMTFEIASENDADKITVDSFGIKPWPETKASKDNVKSLRPTDEDDTYMYWRKTDADNLPSKLKEGRIANSKTAVNIQEATPIASTVETGGFFQGWVSGSPADTINAANYDIMSEVEYGFKITNAVIRFHAFNEVTGENLENVLIRMFNSYQQIVGNDKTDDNGLMTYGVNTTGKTNPTFTYNAALNGYWPIPMSGLLSDRPVIEAETAKVTDVEVPMEQKIYHKPVLKQNTAGEGEPETLELVTDAQLGGEKFAYNDRPYHFRVKAAKGYRILAYPTEAEVYVNDKQIATLSPDVDGLFTLSTQQMSYENNEDLRALKYDELTTLSQDDSDYKDWTQEQPDSEGYRGYNVVVKFDKYEVTELEYIVEGVTNDMGHVTYTAGTTDNVAERPAKTQTDRDSDTYYEYIMVQTLKSDKEADPEVAANHYTGTFKFEPDQEGWLVEKVYINGLRINAYDNLSGFEYTFGQVDMDCNITVIYYDGVNPSDDTVMTLVVGEFGFADVKKPASDPEDKDVILTRRVYLNPTTNLEFEAHAMNGFVLDKVEREVEGEKRVAVTETAKNGEPYTKDVTEGDKEFTYTYIPYSVDKPTAEEKNVTVYVTYRDPRVNKTPSLFVKSYVYSGEGVNKPEGILIYNLYDSVEIALEANTASSYKVKGVMLSPYGDLENKEEWDFPQPYEDSNTYRYDSLMSDLAIGAIYTEKTYKVHGYVDLSQKTNFTEGAPTTYATVTFVRLEGDEGDTERKLRPIKVYAPTTISRKDAQFTADLPEGRWNVYVEKPGYVTYKITEYTFTADRDLSDENVYEFCGTQKIVPYIGSAVTGELINVRDAAYVKSGMQSGINEASRMKADVDDDYHVCYKDLMYIWHNYNQRTVVQPYRDFEANGSKDVKKGPTE